ncbi:hypothetical protein Nmn1133_01350 [Halosegnis longus]|uniref:Uncharacterized protein n=1 Tax=Halosegnis longus TaxID=2216012 RepID=A0AAJ4R6S1_9EURY|nr:hypothetical protein Nmn1133_01350 [Salella cibi]
MGCGEWWKAAYQARAVQALGVEGATAIEDLLLGLLEEHSSGALSEAAATARDAREADQQAEQSDEGPDASNDPLAESGVAGA